MKKLFLIALLSTTQTFAAVTESARCQTRSDSLGGEQAKGRAGWTLKCYPNMKFQADPDGYFYLLDNQNGQKYLGYPTFAQIVDGQAKNWQAPTDPNAPCVDPNTFIFMGFCRAGCYTPDQMVLFSDGYQAISEAKAQRRGDIVSLSPDSRIDNIEFNVSQLRSYTVDPEPKAQAILVIRTEEGGELKVTPNHPLVKSTGHMVEAQSLKEGDMLVSEQGGFEAISSIQEVSYFGKVMNVDMESQDVLDNIVVAQGYLNGSVMFQNQATKKANREVLRQVVGKIGI